MGLKGRETDSLTRNTKCMVLIYYNSYYTAEKGAVQSNSSSFCILNVHVANMMGILKEMCPVTVFH